MVQNICRIDDDLPIWVSLVIPCTRRGQREGRRRLGGRSEKIPILQISIDAHSFQPHLLLGLISQIIKRRSSMHLTHVTFSPNGEEVLLSYSGEHVYLMDVISSDPKNVRLDYALSTANGTVVHNGPLGYSNIFDAIVDATYSALEKVVSAAGVVKHDEIVKMISSLFKSFSRDPTPIDQLVNANPEIRVNNEDIPLVHFAIAFKGAAWTDPNSIPLMVLQSLLGSWNRSIGVGNCSGSELARRVSSDNLADGFQYFYRDTGLFGIYSTAPA